MQRQPNHAGIRVRHARRCKSIDGGRCSCRPTYEAWVFSRRDGEKIRKSFPTLSEAKGWRADALAALRRGTLKAPTRITLREAWKVWLEGARAGTIRTRSGDGYKPSALRSYERAFRLRLDRELGAARLTEIRRNDIQDLVDRLQSEGLDASTIRNTLMPLRAIYRRAIARGEVATNPTTGIELPAVRGRRDRIATPAEAESLLRALRRPDRALWATALYAGLRCGELQALRWEDVDLATGVISVERSWDVTAGAIAPKSKAGQRSVPIAVILRDYLVEHRMDVGNDTELVFARGDGRAFDPGVVRARARSDWKKADLTPITLHECRHTFASLMIAANVNVKAISTYLGHSSVTITLDRYGHLMPGFGAEAAAMLDAYLQTATGQTKTLV